MKNSVSEKAVQILGVSVEPLDMERALVRIHAELEARRQGYVCMVGVHGIMEAFRDPDLAKVYAGAAITVPDGMPTVWVGRWQGHKGMQRVAGPELMWEMFSRKEFGEYTHFLCGGKEHVAEELRERLIARFPWAKVVGTFTPPFRELDGREEAELLERVHGLRPDIVWVGISTPKQERFMRQYLHRLDTTLMFGVGAAFDYHTGRIEDSPQWVKTAGLQWVHRLLQDPRHLWRRYLRNNPAFVWHIALQLTGLRKYSAPTSVVAPRPPLNTPAVEGPNCSGSTS
jgi:N-acetylglucosaminyldiphosphoundecaprenol N-acetyl-beta-D-mannosaminyltransferase